MKTTFTIQGTHCKACKLLIEDVCKDIPEVTSCEVNFATGETVLEHEESLDWDALKSEIEGLGSYKVLLLN
ncbi:heavy-metal-associated domain-containing protein [Candidatus Peregrinibacteria bacterium]|nr:MAG: heavy-metal-associated domain-containing protein [Candidatus Peregrinibacteria bacterium]